MSGPWNLGIKTSDIDADLEFLALCGAGDVRKDVIGEGDDRKPFGMATLQGQRLLLFPEIIYEGALPEPMKLGLAHAVFEVTDLATELSRISAAGVNPFWGPKEIATPFGRRSIAFFCSPSCFVFELFQTVG